MPIRTSYPHGTPNWLELHTDDLPAASAFYARLLGWRAERVDTRAGAYTTLGLGALDGGIVECGTARPLWLPYAEVGDVLAATARANELGARVILDPRDGPAGVRSVLASPSGGEIALWQPKRLARGSLRAVPRSSGPLG